MAPPPEVNVVSFTFFFSSRRRHTRCREVSWARRCVQETGINAEYMGRAPYDAESVRTPPVPPPAVRLTRDAVAAVPPYVQPIPGSRIYVWICRPAVPRRIGVSGYVR
eukprot:TRINITY_DN11131_c0_g1_i2.p2 TRINITY_DN11131_c0_g1~~TRINITY_DN11131_c0_g1_i2.p2  ORF type:complete len:108 (+),score=32.12 TRINITY_DN11131_c0_g1_i2:97-420(+)